MNTAGKTTCLNDIGKKLVEMTLDGNGNWQEILLNVKPADVERALSQPVGLYSLNKLAALTSPAAENYIEQMAQLAHQLTLQRFGRTIRLYAPLYLSNYCINRCRYCGFNKDSDSPRRRLSLDEAVQEADIIASEGFRDILLVSSEDKDFITVDYLAELARRLRRKFCCISIEIYQMTGPEYAKLFKAGIEGVTIYQETYDRDIYSSYHLGGPKADYDNRLRAPDDIAAAGMRELGLGVLLGLADWRLETLALAEHAYYLIKQYWQSHVSISFPRLQPAHKVERGQFEHLLCDKDLVQMMLALRLCFADVGLVLSTRERPQLRDRLVSLGITKMSAGSKTNPGGYSGKTGAVEQFEVNDHRSPARIAEMLRLQGLEAVWKDWDVAFAGGTQHKKA